MLLFLQLGCLLVVVVLLLLLLLTFCRNSHIPNEQSLINLNRIACQNNDMTRDCMHFLDQNSGICICSKQNELDEQA